jgi:hypothetical protein
MSITITDPNLLAQFISAPGFVQVRAPDGRAIGTFFLDGYGSLPPGVTSPISDEEFQEARKEPGGRTLAEIMKRLEAEAGK